MAVRYGYLAMWLGVAGSALVVGTGAWSIVATFTTMSNTLSALSTKVGEIDKELDQAKAKISEQVLRTSSLRASLTEIETQFCAEDIIRNQAHEANQRLQSAMFEKVFGQRLATDNAYYPVICNRQPQSGYGPRAQ